MKTHDEFIYRRTREFWFPTTLSLQVFACLSVWCVKQVIVVSLSSAFRWSLRMGNVRMTMIVSGYASMKDGCVRWDFVSRSIPIRQKKHIALLLLMLQEKRRRKSEIGQT